MLLNIFRFYCSYHLGSENEDDEYFHTVQTYSDIAQGICLAKFKILIHHSRIFGDKQTASNVAHYSFLRACGTGSLYEIATSNKSNCNLRLNYDAFILALEYVAVERFPDYPYSHIALNQMLSSFVFKYAVKDLLNLEEERQLREGIQNKVGDTEPPSSVPSLAIEGTGSKRSLSRTLDNAGVEDIRIPKKSFKSRPRETYSNDR